jgi:hypothetical protein
VSEYDNFTVVVPGSEKYSALPNRVGVTLLFCSILETVTLPVKVEIPEIFIPTLIGDAFEMFILTVVSGLTIGYRLLNVNPEVTGL